VIVLDAHGEELLRQFKEYHSIFERMSQLVYDHLNRAIQKQGVFVTTLEHRVKDEKSLARKLELKASKYHSLDDITDLFGMRVITFFADDVDKVAAIVKQIFDVDWSNSVDKRKLHQLNSFGYNSLHYICRLPKNIVDDSDVPELNTYRFEIQMRTALQHVWSAIEHDIGYKGVVHLPGEYRRQFSRLAGMLELIDDEFSRLRKSMSDYTRKVQALVASGQLEEVPLNIDTFRDYLSLKPFDRLNQRIAAVNQAEIYSAPLLPFLPVLQDFGLETLGDVARMIVDDAEDAYQLALSQLAVTDLDILSETIGLQNLCIVHTLKAGGGRPGLMHILDTINGHRDGNETLVDTFMDQAITLPFMLDKSQK
jgi:ppGpp synthetase/RelA/SpoT-type nucleotidyltranferase